MFLQRIIFNTFAGTPPAAVRGGTSCVTTAPAATTARGGTEGISVLAQAAWNLQQEHPLVHYHIYSGDAERVMERLDPSTVRCSPGSSERGSVM